MNTSEIEKRLVDLVGGKDKFEAAIKEKTEKGTSRHAAVNKLWREHRIQRRPSEPVSGYFLNLYTRKLKRGGEEEETTSMYILTKKGVQKVSVLDETPEPSFDLQPLAGISVQGLVLAANLESKAQWLESTKETKFSSVQIPEAPHKWAASEVKQDGLTVLRGMVQFVNPVGKFDEDGNVTENYPLLSGGKANVRLAIAADGDRKKLVNVKLTSEAGLKALTGWEDLAILEESPDEALQELKDELVNRDVLAFGRAGTTMGEGNEMRKVNPYLVLSEFGWVLGA